MATTTTNAAKNAGKVESAKNRVRALEATISLVCVRVVTANTHFFVRGHFCFCLVEGNKKTLTKGERHQSFLGINCTKSEQHEASIRDKAYQDRKNQMH
ncbi:hypothetical protein FDK21_10130 [Cohaesibacter sp. CAU 1516]|uniref:hypothetical protein n=1 Tax=Cohaesibacter sp. CAU 1516 TaxID=2576038 RepID=UPI0010FD4D3E|nr:hypothetical protein [Cohaesibacter sp. CAU 1516]TLP45976.1 hypothetical protein FDK21_10130 [Cohaesibacter sp. CAU 1516]